MAPSLEILFLALQAVNAAFLLFHDWIPLGPLNNLRAIQSQDSLFHRLWVTLLPGVPAALGLGYSLHFFERSYPEWLEWLLWLTYVTLFAGLLRAWWIPYLFRADPTRAARYQIIFAGTHTFLPRRNGLAPDTLHTLFHLACVACLLLLAVRTYQYASG
jgi:hypothetical protein